MSLVADCVVGQNSENIERTEDIAISEDVTFPGMLLSDKTLAGLQLCGFKKPSPIQLKAIPLGKCGFDLILESKSGTGKTAVFGIISLEMIDLSVDCQVIIIAPTREIASQIGQVLKAIGQGYKGLEIEVVMGGMNLHEEKVRLCSKKYHILVGSPGRMKHLIQHKIVPLDSVRLLVLDEADRLMEKCFQSDINYIFSMLPERKQVIVSSATYTEELRNFLSLYMRTPSHVCPYFTNILIGLNQYISVVPSHLNSVRQNNINLGELKKIMSEIPFKQCVVFCNYQTRTSFTLRHLRDNGWPAECLSGAQSQSDRLRSLDKLQSFNCRVLVATDLAARGIDAANVDLVINLDIPNNLSTYLHRIGRAGRYGTKGIAVTIVPADQEENFRALFTQFGNRFEIKPFQSRADDNSVKLSKSPPKEQLNAPYLESVLAIVTNSKKQPDEIFTFDEICKSLDSFETNDVANLSFDSLMESLNSFSNSVNNNCEPLLCDNSAPEKNLLLYINKKVQDVSNSFDFEIDKLNNILDDTKNDNLPAEMPINYKNINMVYENSFRNSNKGNDMQIKKKENLLDETSCNYSINENQTFQVKEKCKSQKNLKKNKKTKKLPNHLNKKAAALFSPTLNDSSKFIDAEKYLQWKSQLAFVTQCIQYTVYVDYLSSLNNKLY